MNGLIPRAFTLEHAIILLGRALDERRNRGMQLPLVEFMCRGLDNGDQTVETVENDIMRRGIIDLCSGRALALRIDERKGVGVANLFSK